MSKNVLAFIFVALSVVGFSDATYLTVKHYQGAIPPCVILVGCEIVTTSKYSLVFNIPVALLGSLYYLTVLLLTIAYLDTKRLGLLHGAALLTPLGLLATLWFMFAQFVLIKALCVYCLGSAVTSTLLFVFGVLVLRTHETWWNKIRRLWRWR